MTRIAIIGGGISGLAAAFTLEEHRRSGAVDYTLYESSPTLGGVLRTEHIDGCIVEAGPDSFITEKPWAANLCRTLGLGDQLIGSNDADRKTYILVRGRLIPMPDGLMFMVPTKILPTAFSPLFSWATKLRMMQELFHPPRPAATDESVASLVERHYGSEMVDRLADPLLSGVYGGEAASLSVRAVLPRFAEMERTHGSLGRAMLAARKKMPPSDNKPAPPLFTSLKNGMQQLIEAIVARLNQNSLFTNAAVESIHRESEGWTVSATSKSAHYDAVILAVPAGVAAKLFSACGAELSAELAAITYSSSITVGLAYDREVRQSLPPGFGFLVPRSEGKCLLERRKHLAAFRRRHYHHCPHRIAADRGSSRRTPFCTRLQMEVCDGAIRRWPSRPPRPYRAPPPSIARSRARRKCLPRHRCARLCALRPGRSETSLEHQLSCFCYEFALAGQLEKNANQGSPTLGRSLRIRYRRYATTAILTMSTKHLIVLGWR
jgi:protoporphyrinogen/coproporphyrinogen III oxidase